MAIDPFSTSMYTEEEDYDFLKENHDYLKNAGLRDPSNPSSFISTTKSPSSTNNNYEPKETTTLPTEKNITDNSDNKIGNDVNVDEGYIPEGYDKRLGGALIGDYPLGNNMPDGDEFKGTPSIFNEYALMRFHAVAGKDHWKKLYDFEGNYDFRGKVKVSSYFNAFEDGISMTDGKVDAEGIKTLEEKGIKKPANQDIIADKSGDLYTINIDPDIMVYHTLSKDD
jgi:hypothetical protein